VINIIKNSNNNNNTVTVSTKPKVMLKKLKVLSKFREMFSGDVSLFRRVRKTVAKSEYYS
jgi:DNA repair photolyase